MINTYLLPAAIVAAAIAAPFVWLVFVRRIAAKEQEQTKVESARILEDAERQVASKMRESELAAKEKLVAADLTLTHSVAVPWAEIAAAITGAKPALLQDFGLKDRYQGEGVPEGAVNTTIFFRYSAPDRTLQQEEVNQHQAEIGKVLAQRFSLETAKETA